MGRTSLSILLAHLVLGFAFAKPAFGDTDRELSAAKRLSLRFSDSVMRRSPNMHFMRLGRSGSRGSDSFASKVHVKREAYKSAATIEGSTSPTPSLTCVPDADTNGRIVCYSPFNVSRHFLLVTERGNRGFNHREQADEQEDEAVDDQAEGSDVDSEPDARTTTGDRLGADVDPGIGYDDEDGDKEIRDEGPIDESENDAQNWTVRHSRVRDSIKQRLGRSTVSQAEGKDAFGRSGRRHDNFMRLGRAGVKK